MKSTLKPTPGPTVSPTPAARAARLLAIRDIVAGEPITSQHELADRLAARGFSVTQATVSRDIAELGLAKGWRDDRHVYVLPLAAGAARAAPATAPLAGPDARLARILADVPVSVARSGLILVLTGTPGTASVVAQAIDESSLRDQVGTVAGDNTLIVLFADEPALLRWQAAFAVIQARAARSAVSEVMP
jgi:transcriptional regulator of arginine metabolism